MSRYDTRKSWLSFAIEFLSVMCKMCLFGLEKVTILNSFPDRTSRLIENFFVVLSLILMAVTAEFVL